MVDAGVRRAYLDPDNKLLWRFNLRRMDFEQIHDSILAIAGTLDLSVVGEVLTVLGDEVDETLEVTPVAALDVLWRPETQAHLSQGVDPGGRGIGVGLARELDVLGQDVAHVALVDGLQPGAATFESVRPVQDRQRQGVQRLNPKVGAIRRALAHLLLGALVEGHQHQRVSRHTGIEHVTSTFDQHSRLSRSSGGNDASSG